MEANKQRNSLMRRKGGCDLKYWQESTVVSAVLRHTCLFKHRGSVCTRQVVLKEQCRSMGAKLSVLPQRNETNAQMSERGTLAVYSERLVLIGCQLVVCRHGGGGAPSARARGSAAVRITRRGGSLPPSPRGGHSEKWGGHMSKLAMSC